MMTKQYLKMADAFAHDSVESLEQHIYAGYISKHCCEYAAHAINSHDELVTEVERLREFERDALRYRWLMQNTKLGIGRNGKDWDLQVDGSAPDAISEISAWIDNRMDRMM